MGRGVTERAMSRSDGNDMGASPALRRAGCDVGMDGRSEPAPGAVRPSAWLRAAAHEVGQEDRVREGSDAAGHGRDRRGDPGRGLEVDVADEAPLDDVDADVDDDRAGLEHVAGDEARPAGGDHDDVRLAQVRGEVRRPRVADRHRGVLAQEQERGRLADDVGAADDDGAAARQLARRSA